MFYVYILPFLLVLFQHFPFVLYTSIGRGEIMLHIGGIIRAQMFRKKLKQKDLAKALNVNQRTISSYCTNKSFPDLDTLSTICNLLDIDLLFLLEIEKKNNGNLLIQDDEEMRLLEAFRKLFSKDRKEFVESFIRLANLIHD